ncbi:MAG: DUF3786 domain-containing protein [Desulfatiglandaceae bacterium]
MTTQYEKIIRENLSKRFSRLPPDLADHLGAEEGQGGFRLQAFGEDCCICPEEIRFSGQSGVDPRGVLVSLYVLNVSEEKIQLEPFRAYKELPGSMPYQAAFSAHSEHPVARA